MCLDEVPAAENWVAVVGLFDPLTATQAARLAEFAGSGRNVLAVILDQPGTLFTPQDRAALVAALRSVRLAVTAKPQEWRNKLLNRPDLPGMEIVEDEAAEQARSDEFVQFVWRRGSEPR